jgi:transcriptional regulator with XRE-family HTH domain
MAKKTPNQPIKREALGMAIRALREASGATVHALASKTGIPQTLLSRTELGERDVGYLELLMIAEAINADEITLRNLAMKFAAHGAVEARQQRRDLNMAQRRAIEEVSRKLG